MQTERIMNLSFMRLSEAIGKVLMQFLVFRGAQAAIVVYDITNADTFERAKSWVKELQKQVQGVFKRVSNVKLLITSLFHGVGELKF